MLPGRIIDLTHALLPGQEEYGLEIETFRVPDLYPQYRSRPEDHYIMTRIRMSPHIGTHIEAPYHLLQDGGDVATLPLDKLVGQALIMDFTHKMDDEAITLDDIQAYAGRIHPEISSSFEQAGALSIGPSEPMIAPTSRPRGGQVAG